jgi:hypothetical protein
MANPRNYRVPLPLFRSRIIHHDAVYKLIAEVAPIIPNQIFAEAGNHEKPVRDSLIRNVRRRVLFRQKSSR